MVPAVHLELKQVQMFFFFAELQAWTFIIMERAQCFDLFINCDL
jgi:hypothetical protein